MGGVGEGGRAGEGSGGGRGAGGGVGGGGGSGVSPKSPQELATREATSNKL